MINRKELVSRHNPILRGVNTESPLTVGNGDFAFTADITGLQTLYDEYYEPLPLCTMSNWGWHTAPNKDGGYYSPDDIKMTYYDCGGKKVSYASDTQSGNEDVYNWLRQNPHRLNLARISLSWNGREITPSDITNIRQELELYTGVLHSRFTLFGVEVKVTTVCAQSADVLGFRIESEALSEGLSAVINFPYGSHKKHASDWENPYKHETWSIDEKPFRMKFKRVLDRDIYYVAIYENENTENLSIREFTHAFSKESDLPAWDFDEVLRDSADGWREFWENGGAVDFSRCKDKRANELERRVILSMYLTAVNCSGRIPPQETGLTCNSWYGKFHLEMHILHSGWLPLWGREKLLEKSLAWYESILDNAVKNAARNGYKGARWVKITGPEGVDSPSRIATLLIWQQPHLIYMLDLIARAKPESERPAFMRRYWELARQTAEFMADFALYNETTGKFDLPPPLIPAQEEHKPEDTLNPAFELCYWRFGLKTAVEWAKKLGKEYGDWERVYKNMADAPVHNGLYTAHQNCPDTFERFNRDHPSMLFGCGFLPPDNIDLNVMSDTCDKVLDCWDFKTMWGWDFALAAMTLTRLGKPGEAVDILLKETEKNYFAANGHNFQRARENNDLPLYLPGNGALLFALAFMLKDWVKDWDIEVEGISFS